MKYAGLMKPPPMLTQDVYEYIISQVATNYVNALKRKVRELKEFRDTEEPRYEPLLILIDDLRRSVNTKSTRDIYSKYKDFYDLSLGLFGYGYATAVKMKDFSGVKDPLRREKVKDFVEDQIKSNLDRMESSLSYGERMISEVKEKIKDFNKLITVNLKPMKKDEVREMQFPIYLDEWYVGQQELDEYRERITQQKRDKLNKLKSVYESVGNADVVAPLIAMVEDNLKKIESDSDNLPHLNVKIQVSNKDPKWMPGTNTFFMPIKDADQEVKGSSMMPSARVVNNWIQKIVLHEMTHAGQTILSRIRLKIDEGSEYIDRMLKSTLAGMPSKKIKTPQYKQDPTKSRDSLEKHHLDDVEFYTDLRDSIREVMEKMKYHEDKGIEYGIPLKPQEKNLLFKALVGQDISREERASSDFLNYVRPVNFFLSLKRKAKPKYIKAVGEAYKLVFGSFARQRMAKRIAYTYFKNI